MTLALSCPQDCKHPGQLPQVSLASALALTLHPSVFISASFEFGWQSRPILVPVSGAGLTFEVPE